MFNAVIDEIVDNFKDFFRDKGDNERYIEEKKRTVYHRLQGRASHYDKRCVRFQKEAAMAQDNVV